MAHNLAVFKIKYVPDRHDKVEADPYLALEHRNLFVVDSNLHIDIDIVMQYIFLAFVYGLRISLKNSTHIYAITKYTHHREHETDHVIISDPFTDRSNSIRCFLAAKPLVFIHY